MIKVHVKNWSEDFGEFISPIKLLKNLKIDEIVHGSLKQALRLWFNQESKK